jgi:hypothetical protein
MILERENNNSNSKINKKYDAAILLNNFDSKAALKSKTYWNSVFSVWRRVRKRCQTEDLVILQSLPDFPADG